MVQNLYQRDGEARHSTIKRYRTLILHEVHFNYKIKDGSNCNNFNLYPRDSYIVECDETIKLINSL